MDIHLEGGNTTDQGLNASNPSGPSAQGQSPQADNPILDNDKTQAQSAKPPVEILSNEPGTRSLYSTDDESNDMVDLESLGFNTTIQQKKSELLDPSQLNDTVISSVMSQEDQPKSDDPVLEKLDSFEDDLNLSLVIERENERKAALIKYIFIGLLGLTIILGAWFFTDARSLLGYTSIQESSQETTQQALVNAKTDLSFSKYYLAALKSQNLSFLAVELREAYINSENQLGSDSSQAEGQAQIEQIMPQIISELDSIVEYTQAANKVTNTNELKVSLITKINSGQYQDLINQNIDDQIQVSEFLSIDQLNNEISNLITKDDIRYKIQDANYSQMTPDQMLNFLTELFGMYTDSKLKELALLSLKRSNFTHVLGEIAEITRTFDPNFVVFDDREDYIVKHNSYAFNADNSNISVSTDIQTTTPDTFTMIANFEDAILKSKMFSGLNLTSFQKQADKDGEKYNTSLNLTFQFRQI